jgi:hypothetical protein
VRFKNLSINVSSPHLNSIKTSSGSIFTVVNTVMENSLEIEAEAGSIVKGKFDIKQAAAVSIQDLF